MTATVPVSGTYDGAVPQTDPNTVIGKVFMVFEAFRGIDRPDRGVGTHPPDGAVEEHRLPAHQGTRRGRSPGPDR